MARIAGALEALLTDVIDYAGLYPPASLPLPIVCERYRGFLASPERWMLNRLVLPLEKLGEAALGPGARVTLLVEDEPGPLPALVQTLETKLPHSLSLPTYCEAPLDAITGAYAKVRTGGLTPDAIPAPAALADYLLDATARRMPFKATAGLHHPIRSERRLTYALDSVRGTLHGFLNVLVAASFAWHGLDRERLRAVLEEREAKAFRFGADELEWSGHRLTVPQIREARRSFLHSFGSCSFEEPVSELRELGLLP